MRTLVSTGKNNARGFAGSVGRAGKLALAATLVFGGCASDASVKAVKRFAQEFSAIHGARVSGVERRGDTVSFNVFTSPERIGRLPLERLDNAFGMQVGVRIGADSLAAPSLPDTQGLRRMVERALREGKVGRELESLKVRFAGIAPVESIELFAPRESIAAGRTSIPVAGS